MTGASGRRNLLIGLLAVGLLACVVPELGAQGYPDRTVRIIVPFPPGGLNDTVARLLQPHLEKALGQPVIIDNRPAASGIVGSDAVAKATPDGHTLLLVASSHTVVPATNTKLPYNAARDFAPIAIVAKGPFLFVANPKKVAATTLGEFVALAKTSPGALNYASPGAASQTHLLVELFSRLAGIKLQHIPYRGGNPAILATVAGDTELTVISALVSLPHIQAGALRALATSTAARAPQLPNVPSVAEQGFPGFDAAQWLGLLTTAGTPAEIVTRVNAEVNRALKDPELIARLAAQGLAPAGGTPDEFATLIATEIRNWTEVAREANIRVE
jgi:tripartite-type tricarboxylate transporter receptor subunit TctC